MKRAARFSTILFTAIGILGTGCTDKSPVNPEGDPNTDISQLMYQPTLNTATYQQPLYRLVNAADTTDTILGYPDQVASTYEPLEAYGDSVLLAWSSTFTGGSISSDSLYKYYIYRGRSAATVFLLDSVSGVLDSAGTKVDTLPVTTYIDNDIIPDVTNDFIWYYQVSAGKLNGYEGAKSNVQSVTIPHTYYFRNYEN